MIRCIHIDRFINKQSYMYVCVFTKEEADIK